MPQTEKRSSIPVVADGTYFRICLVNLEAYDQANAEFERLRQEAEAARTQPWWRDIPTDLVDRMGETSVVVIVFAAFCLEALINHYGHTRMGETAFRDVDKLGLREKWFVIPRLVTGKEIPRGNAACSFLKKLISRRNDLAHFKTKQAPIGMGKQERRDKYGRPSREAMGDAVKAVFGMVEELRRVDPDWRYLDRYNPERIEGGRFVQYV